MDLKPKQDMPLEAPLASMNEYLDKKGYHVMPKKVKEGYTFLVFKDCVLIKEGKQVYNDWQEGLKYVTNKIYKVL